LRPAFSITAAFRAFVDAAISAGPGRSPGRVPAPVPVPALSLDSLAVVCCHSRTSLSGCLNDWMAKWATCCCCGPSCNGGASISHLYNIS